MLTAVSHGRKPEPRRSVRSVVGTGSGSLSGRMRGRSGGHTVYKKDTGVLTTTHRDVEFSTLERHENTGAERLRESPEVTQ